MTKISVIVPVYNGEKYLLECLQSIQKQTFSDWECICVDDGSRDESLSILQGIAQKDARFRVISQPNGGVTSARRNGVEHADGEYVSFVDCDDVLPPEALEILISRREEYDADIVIGNWMTTTDTLETGAPGDLPASPLKVTGIQTLKYINRFGWLWRNLFQKNLFTYISWPKPQIRVGEDSLTLFDLLLKTHKVVLIPDIVYFYRMQNASVMHKIEKDPRKKAELFLQYTIGLDSFIRNNNEKDLSPLRMLVVDSIFNKFSSCGIFSQNRKLLLEMYIRHFVFSLGCQKIYWNFSWKNWVWMWIAGCKFFYNSSK
jgi:glycosyltransferase, family 2